MAYYDNTYYYDPMTTGASDAYPLQGMPLIGEELYTQMPDSLDVGWGMVGGPGLDLGPNLQAPALPVITNATNYGKHNSHPLVDWCLTGGLQRRWLPPLRTYPRPVGTLSHPTRPQRSLLSPNPSSQAPRVGIVHSPTA